MLVLFLPVPFGHSPASSEVGGWLDEIWEMASPYDPDFDEGPWMSDWGGDREVPWSLE